jgi:iron complex outermembrane receptor protein
MAGAFCLAIAALLPAQTGETGTLIGVVANAGTRNLLEGVRVEIAGLGRTTLTDSTGRYVFSEVPAGPQEIVASYLGLDTQRAAVTVVAGRRNTLDIDLSTEVYQLEKLQITGQVEGNALALTAQRNAGNVKNVVALDAYGNLPNMSAGELAIRLPGVASQLDDEGNVTGLIVRGSSSQLNRVNVDGALMANVGGFNRQFQTHSLTGAMFEQLEVIKAATPDQSADSLGGAINLKTRSTLGMKERRRFAYSVGARWAPPFYDHVQLRRSQPVHPLTNFAYQEVFDVLGGERNLGVAVNLFYSENVNAPSSIQYDYQNTAASPAYAWDFRTQNQINNRTQKSLNLKAEYRLSDRTKLIFNTIYNDAFEKSDRLYTTRAFSNQTVATLDGGGQPTGTGAVVPGYTDTRTEVRAVSGSNFELSTFRRRFLNRTRLFRLGAEHELDRWQIDYEGGYSQTHANLGHEPGGNLVMRVPNVGWILDTTNPDAPVFTQTAGPSIYDIANYRNSVSLLTRNDDRDIEVTHAQANALRRFEGDVPAHVKAGVFYREQKVAEIGQRRRWNYLATAPAMNATQADVFAFPGAGRLPYVDPQLAYEKTGDATLWAEDVYFRESDHFSTTRNATEEIAAAYLQGQARFDRTAVLAGVRTERTEVSGFGFVQTANASATLIPDPVARANYNWNHPVTNEGSYTRSFPSIHVTHEFTENLRLQASWSTSFGRPNFTNLMPSASISDTNQTVTIGNPALGPQYAKNVDVVLQYYIRPAGVLSVGYFTKNIKDYIRTTLVGTVGVGADNGFNGSYEGYDLLTSQNTGTAKVRGWEFDYRQQFTSLPSYLRGLGVSANFTALETRGDFGGTTVVANKDVSGFIPRTANAGLNYSYGRFGFSALLNYTGDHLATDSTTPHRRIYRQARTIVNFGGYYDLRPEVRLFCDLSNAFNKPQATYIGFEHRPQRTIYTGQTLTFGVSGRF